MNFGLMLPAYPGGVEDPILLRCLCNGNPEMATLAGLREKIVLHPVLDKTQYLLSQLFL